MAASSSKASSKTEEETKPESNEPAQHEHGDYSEYMNDAEPDYDAPETNAKEVSA